MAGLGAVLVLVGFALLIPRGVMPGSQGVRNVPLRGQVVVRTPGHSEEPEPGRNRWIRFGVALAMLATGAALVALGS